MKRAIFLVAVCIFGACAQKRSAKAIIFERKKLSGNRLLIRYQYDLDGKMYTDSAVVVGQIIVPDTLTVLTDSRNPSKSLPDVSR